MRDPQSTEQQEGAAHPALRRVLSRRLPYVLLAGAGVLLGSVSLIYPHGRDQGIYAFIAQSALEGKVMYRDILMGMAPFTVVLHMIAHILFGRSMTSIRVLDVVWTMATGGFLYEFARRALGRQWLAIGAGVMYLFLYYLFGFWDSAQVDGFLNLPVVAAFALVLPAIQSPTLSTRLRWLGAGTLLGVAVFFKYPIGLLLPALAAFAVYATVRARRPGARIAFGPLWLLAGTVLVVAAVGLFLLVSGALTEFLAQAPFLVVVYPALSYLRESLPDRMGRLLAGCLSNPDYSIGFLFGALGFAVSAALFVGRKFLFVGNERTPILMVWVWFAVSLVAVFIQGRFFPYHLLPLLPVLSVLSVLALAGLLEPLLAWRLPRLRRVALLAAIAAGVLASTAYPGRLADLARVVSGITTMRDYWFLPRQGTRDFRLSEQIRVADYLRAQTDPEDRVLVWGVDPLINYLARRKSATRFIYNHPLTSVWSWTGLREEFLRGLEASPPEVLVVVQNDATPIVTGHNLSSYESLLEFTALKALVAREYEFETRIGRFDILRRKTADATLPNLGMSYDRLKGNLHEALRVAASIRADDYKTILWPWSLDSAPPGRPFDLVRSRLVSYRELITLLWLQGVDINDLLPCVSIWVVEDTRPFANLPPFSLQSSKVSFVAAGLRFTILDTSPDGSVILYLMDNDTGKDSDDEEQD